MRQSQSKTKRSDKDVVSGLKIRAGHRSLSVQKLCATGQRSLPPVIVTDHI